MLPFLRLTRPYRSLIIALAHVACVVVVLPAFADQQSLDALAAFLKLDPAQRGKVDSQPFAKAPLTQVEATAAGKLLWEDHVRQIRESRAAEMKERKLREGDFVMPFHYEIFGEKPKNGRSLYISMHGGGGAPKAINDSQWENQKRLYRPAEGVYLAPRAPTDTWNLWHQGHIDALFGRLMENLIVFEEVDPNRVYLLGYSAGGDGVYQLAPRLADRLAAASMMAGHPNDASPLGLRNLPFSIHVGANDAGYGRNKVAAEWGAKLDELQKADPEGYVHFTKIYANKGHWMDREDAAALPWMAKFTREPLPKKVVWRHAGPRSTRFYWLAVEPDDWKPGHEVVATRDGQKLEVTTKGPGRVILRLSDEMLSLDEPVVVSSGGKELHRGVLPRTIGTLAQTLAERGDPRGLFSAEIVVAVPKP